MSKRKLQAVAPVTVTTPIVSNDPAVALVQRVVELQRLLKPLNTLKREFDQHRATLLALKQSGRNAPLEAPGVARVTFATREMPGYTVAPQTQNVMSVELLVAAAQHAV